jgi:ankyrin repeat protein
MLKKDFKNEVGLLLRKRAAKGDAIAVKKILNENKNNSSFDINEQSSNGNTALHWACLRAVEIDSGYSEKYSKTIQCLIQGGADHLIENKSGKRPYHFLQEMQIKVTRTENFLIKNSKRESYCYFTLINELLRIECAKVTLPEELEGELAVVVQT